MLVFSIYKQTQFQKLYLKLLILFFTDYQFYIHIKLTLKSHKLSLLFVSIREISGKTFPAMNNTNVHEFIVPIW